MTPAQKYLAQLLFHIGAVDDKNTRPLKSQEGMANATRSPVFLNLRTPENPKPGTLTPKIVYFAAYEMFQVFAKLNVARPMYIVGVPNAGDPFARVIHQIFTEVLPDIDLIKMTKVTDAGGRRVAGIEDASKLKRGHVALLVDDLITQAHSKLEAIDVLGQHGILVDDLVVLVDREQGGVQEIQKTGRRVHAVFRITELLDFYVQEGSISSETRDAMQRFIADNQAV